MILYMNLNYFMTYDANKIKQMTEGGAKIGIILSELMDMASPGISLLDIEAKAQYRIKEAGGTPSFQTVPGYTWATCLCVNEVIVHGIPTNYMLKDGDVLTIDIGMVYKGFHTDTGWSKIVGTKKEKSVETFLKVGEKALRKSIEQAKVGNRIGHISQVMQQIIEGAGYGIVKTLVGHGVGKELHEPPQIPGFLRGSIENTLPILLGMTIAVEVIYTMGKPVIYYPNNDGWSIATRDHSLSAVFEHTLAILEDGPHVLTLTKN